MRKTHGQSRLPGSLYSTWASMKDRCTNPNSTAYEFYGGRGISVCAKWADSFEAFMNDMGERPKGATLDRINNSGNYEPGNCKWSTKSEQAFNTRLQSNNTSGTKGVTYDNSVDLWKAYIKINGKRKYLGGFHKKEDAVSARQQAEYVHLQKEFGVLTVRT